MKKVQESPEAHYREALKKDRFEIQKCDGCRQYCFPPRIVCPNCGGADLQWQTPSGTGVVYSSTVVSRRDEQGGPYNVVLVSLDEGVRLMSHVTGFGPNEVPIDQKVQARIEADSARLVFDPV